MKSFPGETKERDSGAVEGKGGDVPTYTSKRRFCFSSKKKSRTNFLTKSGFRVLSITSVRPNWKREETQRGQESQHNLCIKVKGGATNTEGGEFLTLSCSFCGFTSYNQQTSERK